MMKPVQVGVCGYGHYVRGGFLPQFAGCEHIRIAGVYNRGEERRRQAAEDGYRTTGDLDELLAIPELEAVYIGTSNAVHKEQCVAAARAGKHILCDKPLALSIEDVNAICDAARAAGIVTHVNHGTPYSEAFQSFRRVMGEHCGRILHVWVRASRGFGNWAHGARHGAVSHPELSGGWTFHHLCHALDEACILVGKRAVSVYHLMQKSTEDCPSEELVNSLLTFEGGATAYLADGTNIGRFLDKGVLGVDADIRLLGDTIQIVKPGKPAGRGRPGILDRHESSVPLHHGGEDKCTPLVARYFAEAIRGGENRLLSFDFVRDQYCILAALQRSGRSGRAETVEY